MYFVASIPKNGTTVSVTDAADHGGEGGGQGALAQARGARRPRALLAHPSAYPALSMVTSEYVHKRSFNHLITERYFTFINGCTQMT